MFINNVVVYTLLPTGIQPMQLVNSKPGNLYHVPWKLND